MKNITPNTHQRYFQVWQTLKCCLRWQDKDLEAHRLQTDTYNRVTICTDKYLILSTNEFYTF